MEITAEAVHAAFRYDPETGLLFWKERSGPRVVVGSPAGAVNKTTGYVVLRWRGKLHYVHRLIFLHVTGRVPEQTDHANGDRADNRWANLRECTDAQNRQNMKPLFVNNSSGINGVYWHKQSQKWHVSIGANGRKHSFGLHSSIDAAAAAAKQAKEMLHPFNARA